MRGKIRSQMFSSFMLYKTIDHPRALATSGLRPTLRLFINQIGKFNVTVVISVPLPHKSKITLLFHITIVFSRPSPSSRGKAPFQRLRHKA